VTTPVCTQLVKACIDAGRSAAGEKALARLLAAPGLLPAMLSCTHSMNTVYIKVGMGCTARDSWQTVCARDGLRYLSGMR
jgi:hypothetical protein